MIDPDGIIIERVGRTSTINIENVPECDIATYDLEEDEEGKGFKIFIADVEKEVRGSFEYRQFITYLRNYMGMDTCSFISTVSNKESTSVRIEIHHYPFSLYDICVIVYKKRAYYRESLELEMVAKEVMELHYKAMVGLIPLSETVHKLVHNGKLFIPVHHVFGRYDLFMTYYDPFISEEQKDVIYRIEKYSSEIHSELSNTTILDTNNLTLNVKNEEFRLPPITTVRNLMKGQIQKIKDNSYQLPTAHEKIQIENKRERQGVYCPIYFIDGGKEGNGKENLG